VKWRRYNQLSINKRLIMIPFVAIMPMIVLVCYLVWTVSSATAAYAGINKNVERANQYVRDFKERIDYTMYLSVIRNKSINELDIGKTTINGIVTVNPYDYIEFILDYLPQQDLVEDPERLDWFLPWSEEIKEKFEIKAD